MSVGALLFFINIDAVFSQSDLPGRTSASCPVSHLSLICLLLLNIVYFPSSLCQELYLSRLLFLALFEPLRCLRGNKENILTVVKLAHLDAFPTLLFDNSLKLLNFFYVLKVTERNSVWKQCSIRYMQYVVSARLDIISW